MCAGERLGVTKVRLLLQHRSLHTKSTAAVASVLTTAADHHCGIFLIKNVISMTGISAHSESHKSNIMQVACRAMRILNSHASTATAYETKS